MPKKYEELTIVDDFMFHKVMTTNPDLCKQLLEFILQKKIRKVSFPEGQKVINIRFDSKSVRLDIYLEDDEDTVYNVEMQTTDTQELPKRARYYQGMIDLNLIEKGESYRKLKKSFVIFLSDFDLFKESQYIYTFENICREIPGLRLEDESYKIFVNASGSKGDIPEELKEFLALMKDETPKEGSFARQIQEQVEKVREHKEWRQEYMTLLMRDQENREKGRLEGRLEERINIIAKSLRDPNGEYFVREIMEATDREIAEAKELLQKQS